MNKPMNTNNKVHLLKMSLNLMRVLMSLKSSRMMKKINLILAYPNYQMRFFIFKTNKIFKEKLYFTRTFYFNQELKVQTLFKYLCQF